MKESQAERICTLDFSRQIEGIRVGKIININEQGQVIVDFADNQKGKIPARFTSSLNLQKLREAALEGRKVLLVFENNDPNLPIIIDTLHSLLDEVSESMSESMNESMNKSMNKSLNESMNHILEEDKSEDVMIDGKRITFDAKEEIVLRCGKASITLTRAGKIIIRGGYLLSRSSGVNRVKGGSVQIN